MKAQLILTVILAACLVSPAVAQDVNTLDTRVQALLMETQELANVDAKMDARTKSEIIARLMTKCENLASVKGLSGRDLTHLKQIAEALGSFATISTPSVKPASF